MSFILDDKQFDSQKANVPKQSYTLELKRLDPYNFAILEHDGDHVNEIGCYTRDELFVIWKMLSEK
jgi:hypothetical protein